MTSTAWGYRIKRQEVDMRTIPTPHGLRFDDDEHRVPGRINNSTPVLGGAEADEYLKLVNELQDDRKTQLTVEVGHEYRIVTTRTIIKGVHYKD